MCLLGGQVMISTVDEMAMASLDNRSLDHMEQDVHLVKPNKPTQIENLCSLFNTNPGQTSIMLRAGAAMGSVPEFI